MAAAKILGRNWQQRHQKQHLEQQQQQQLLQRIAEASNETTPVVVVVKKKYKKKKHSLSSPSLGKYSPLLLRKVFQQNQNKDPSNLVKVEVRLDEEDGEDEFETSFSLWASEAENARLSSPFVLLHGEERTRSGVGKREEEPFSQSGLDSSNSSLENNKNNLRGTLHASSSLNNNSCSLAVQHERASHYTLSVPLKKKKKSIISSLSLGGKESPKKLKDTFTVPPPNPNLYINPIWNRRQAVKKSRKSLSSLVSLIPEQPAPEPIKAPPLEVLHCSNTECCCHVRKTSNNAECSVCREPEQVIVVAPRKKSSFLLLSRIPVSAKRHLKHRNMLVGKTTVRMNSEPLLGRRSTKQKHSLSMGESTSSATPSQPPPPIPPRTGLIPRRDFGPAASNPRPPMLRFSRGSWLSRPTEEQPSKEPATTCSGKKSSQSKSTRRHSAPPVSSRASRQSSTVTLFNTTSLSEIMEKGTINRRIWKTVNDKRVSGKKFFNVVVVVVVVKTKTM